MVLLSLTVTVQAAECVVPSAPVICRITLVEPAAAAVAVTLYVSSVPLPVRTGWLSETTLPSAA